MKKSLLLMLFLALTWSWTAQADETITLSEDVNQAIVPGTTYYFYDSGGSSSNYGTSETYTATFTCAGAITINFSSFTTESSSGCYNWDYMLIYDGDANTGTLLARGQTGCPSSTLTIGNNIVAESGVMTIKWFSDSSSPAAGWVATIVGAEPASNPKPIGLIVSGITHNSATLSWTEKGVATSWQICLNDDETNLINAGENPYTLSNLTPLTPYSAKVRSVGSEYSEWSSVVNFSTTAVATPVGNEWSDNFEGTSCGWELINGSLTNAWAWGTAANNGGTHALYISNDGGTTNAYTNNSAVMVYAVKLLNFADGKYEFAYDWQANGESTYDYLRVALVPASIELAAGTSAPSGFGSSTLPTDWIALDGGSKLNLVTSWQHKGVAINVTSGNYYLVLAWRDDTSSGTNPPAAVDNVIITKLACPYDVADLAVDPNSITTSSADISWTAGEATQWQIAHSKDNSFPDGQTTMAIVSEASASLSGLDASSTYFVKVRAYCGGEDFGAWSDVISFATECEAFSNYPYSEKFDSYVAAEGLLPICWNRINTCTYSSYNASKYPRIYGYSAYSASNCLYLYSSYSSWYDYDPQPQYAILPEMSNLAGKQITLWARGYNAASSFKIGWMSDPTDVSTFNLIDEQTFTSSNYSTYQELTYEIPATISGNYIAIMIDAASSSRTTNAVYVDDITVEQIPSCKKPKALKSLGVTAHTAKLTWTPGSADQDAWQIAIGDSANFDPKLIPAANLIAADNDTFVVSLPKASKTYYAYVRADCGSEKSAWSTKYASFTTVAGNKVPTGLAYNPATLLSDQADVSWDSVATNDYHMSYQLCYSLDDTLAHGIIIRDIDSLHYHFTGLTADKTYYVWVRDTCGSDSLSAWSKSISFKTASDCQTPDGLAASEITAVSAKITWNTYGKTEFNLSYGRDTENMSLVENIACPYTITGLLADSTYLVIVQPTCAADTIWSEELIFKTAKATPFAETFSGATALPAGWFKSNTLLTDDILSGIAKITIGSGSWYVNARNGVLGGNHAYRNVYGTTCHDWLIMPAIQIGSNCQLTFDLALTDYNNANTADMDGVDDKFIVLISANEGASWTKLRQWDNAGSEYVYNNIATAGKEIVIDVTQYAGQTVYVAFYCESTVSNADNDIHVGNVKIAEIPSCFKPTDLVLDTVAANSATLSWIAGGSEAAWEYAVVKADSAIIWNNQYATDTFVVISGLEANTSYDFYVRSSCDNNEHSDSIKINFSTECGKDTIPYSYDFETQRPFNCWTPIAGAAIASGSSSAHSGSNYLKFSGKTPNMILLPEFAEATNNLRLEFWTRPEGNTYASCGTFSVGYLTNVSDTSSFVEVENYAYNEWTSNEYVKKTIDFDQGNVPNNAIIAFRHNSKSTSYYWYVDDVTVKEIPSCFAPTILGVSDITDASAKFNWSKGDKETQWQWACIPAGSNSLVWDGNIITDTFVTVSNLTQASSYEFYVRAYCSTSDQSEAAMLSFMTLQTPANLPYNDDFESGNKWLLINGDLVNAWVVDTAAHNGGSKALYISNDGGETNAYTNNEAAMVYATKMFNFEVGKYVFSYDWRCYGESTWDYMRVALVPDAEELSAGTTVPSGFSPSGLPTGWIALDGGSKLNLKSDWQKKEVVINVPAAGLYKMVFGWRDDTSGGSQPPAAVDNVHICKVDSVSINESRYATYYNANASYLMPTGLTGHAYTVDAVGKGHLSDVTLSNPDVVPAGTPLVLEGDAGKYMLIPTWEPASIFDEANELEGVSEVTVITDVTGYTNFVLSLASGNIPGETGCNYETVGFYWVGTAGVELQPNRAYLKVDNSKLSTNGAPAAFFLIDDENNATWLNSLEGVEGTVKFLHEGNIYILRDSVIYDATGKKVRELK